MAGVELGDTQDPRQVSNSMQQVSAMQQFLKNRGYNIAVDGVRGPQTNAAVLAFHKKVAPNAWNGQQNGGRPPVASTMPAPAPAPAAKVAPKKAAKVAKSHPAGAAVDPATGQLIDPRAYAAGVANAQYNPQISELLRQLTQGRADETSHTKQIQDWFSQALAAHAQDTAANAAAGRDAQGDYNAAGQNVLDLFGGPGADKSTAAEAAAFHDIGLGNLSADVNAQGQFDRNMKGVEALQGSEAQRSQFNSDQAGLKDLAGKLVDLRGAKGSAYAAAYQQGTQNRTQQQAAQQQLALAKALAPAQIAQANAGAAVARANATTAGVNAANAGVAAKTDLAIAKARLKAANIQTQKALATNNGTWDLSRPEQQGALQKALETNIFGPRGGLAINPESAWANVQQQLKMNGLENDPEANRIAQGIFLQGLWTSHGLGNFGGFAWNGQKIVRTGNKYAVNKKTGKRALVNSKGQVIPDYKPYSK